MDAPDIAIEGDTGEAGHATRAEAWRKGRGLTYEQLARPLDCHWTSVRRQCLGRQFPERATLLLWLQHTGGEVQPNHFLGLPGVHPAVALRAAKRLAVA